MGCDEWWRDVVKLVPDYAQVPTFSQMVQRTQQIVLRYPGLVTLTRVGVSQSGEPIDMISVGNGPGSALFVGAPHPNEVVGCLVIEHLIEQLCMNPAFRQMLPYRCHFIKAIELDALRLNEGWFCAPGDLRQYYENYYRPPLDQQAEYAFPFEVDDRWIQHPMPENLAWRTALELSQPDLLFSLHNSEFGGAHFVTSGMPDGLSDGLKGLCSTYGLPLNTLGEAAFRDHQYEPGLCRFPDMKDLLGADLSAPQPPGMRAVGNSSAGYAAPLGTFSLFAEVPYWDSAQLQNTSMSPHSSSDIEAALSAWTARTVALAGRALALDYPASHHAAHTMWRVIQAHFNQFASSPTELGGTAAGDEALSWSQYTLMWVSGTLERLSTVALARRLALASMDRVRGFQLAAECSQALSAVTATVIHDAVLRPVPFMRLAQFQLHAGLIAMHALMNQ